MKGLINHCKIFLSRGELLDSRIEGLIKTKLGIIHFFYKDARKAKSLLEEGIGKLQNFHEEIPTRIAFAFGYLGNVYRDLGDYNKSKI